MSEFLNPFCGVKNNFYLDVITLNCKECKGKGYIQGEYAQTGAFWGEEIDWNSSPVVHYVMPCECKTRKERP